ncbi:MAG TPA: hypothetical protein VK116_01975, partial [Planctomycetota bacterium]|nr:hypothetical protein [Planctomycetota bacterium]
VPEATTIDGATRELAVRAASAVGARVAGVDLLSSRDGKAYVIEVNAVPGWRALSRVTGIDVARAVVRRAMADAPAPYGEIASAKKG